MTTTYSQARENLASLWDEVENAREAAIISRRGHEDMALLPAAELRSLQETAYLLRSPRNAARLLAALEQSRQGTGTAYTPEQLAVAIGLPGANTAVGAATGAPAGAKGQPVAR